MFSRETDSSFQNLAMHDDLRQILSALLLHNWENGLHNLRVGALVHHHLRFSGHDRAMVLLGGIAGLGHDVGKIGSPPELLRRPGKLSFEEKELLQNHVRYGLWLLEGNDLFSSEALCGIEQHHAWRRSQPYPYRKELTIPVSRADFIGQILTACDMYDRVAVGSCFSPPTKESFIELKIAQEFTGLPSIVTDLMIDHFFYSDQSRSLPQKISLEAESVAKLLLPNNVKEHVRSVGLLDEYKKLISGKEYLLRK